MTFNLASILRDSARRHSDNAAIVAGDDRQIGRAHV